MFFMSVVLFLFLTMFKENKCALRIIGGKNADENQYSYVASLGISYFVTNSKDRYDHICTCTILTPNWTLTAAHCTRRFDEYFESASTTVEKHLRHVIRYKSNSPKTKYNVGDILKVIKHPAYKNTDFNNPALHIKRSYNDVCLLRTEPVYIMQYGRLSAIDYAALTGLEATAVGFGRVNYTSNPHKVKSAFALKKLQVLNVIVVKCPGYIANIRYPLICIARKCGQRSMLCPGDSGGPLLHTTGVIGVNSISLINCYTAKGENDKTSISGGVTVISPFIGWIQKKIKTI